MHGRFETIQCVILQEAYEYLIKLKPETTTKEKTVLCNLN